jgi:outer membrane biosynthesis protein TonB
VAEREPAEPEAEDAETDEPEDEGVAEDAEPEAAEPETAEPDDAEASQDTEDEPEPEPAPKRIPARKIARWAAEQVMEMTGKESESVTSVRKDGEGGWVVGLEVVESHRIPSSTDVLAIYEAEMDGDGELLSYRRVKRYTRGRGEDE